MTVNTTNNAITYQGNGSTTTFTFPFAYVDADSILVFVTVNGVLTQQPKANYSIVLNPPIDPNPTGIGGTVTYPLTGPPLPVGQSISIARVLPAIQDVSLGNQSIIYPPVVESEFDYLTMMSQQGQNVVDRSFKVSLSDPIPADVPAVALRKNQQAFFDSSGNLVGGSFTSPGVVVSGAMIPVVGAASIAQAQVLLGTQAMIDASVSAAVSAVFTTGDLKPTHKTVADPGWILWSDGTIGNAVSGSSIRANADTRALFSLYYNNYTDALCPLLSSTGTVITRASTLNNPNVAFDNPNNCRMSLPRGAGRSFGIAGQGVGLTNRPLGSTVGVESITQTLAQMASHVHDAFGHYFMLSLGNILAEAGSSTYSLSALVGTTNYAGGNQPMNIMQPTTYVNIMVKL